MNMNAIVRMIKRYIKTPLKYALPLLFIGALVLVSISGCTSPATTSPSPTAQQAQVTAAPTSEASPTAAPTANSPAANAYVVDGMEFHAAPVANPPQALGSSGDTTPAAGNVYVAFDCTVKNINAPTDSNTRIGMTYWQLRDKAGNVYDPEIFVTGTPGVKTFESVDSQHGDIVHGYVFFEVPANHGDWKSLTYNDGGRNAIINL